MTKLFDLIFNDIKTIFTSFSILAVIIGGNILYAFFYPSPYLNDILIKQKIALVDDDNSTLSREFIFRANATSKVEIIVDTTMQEARNLLEQNKIYGILYIPKDFEQNSIKSSVPQIYYIANNSYFLIYSTIIEGLNNVANSMSFDIKIKQSLYNKNAFNGNIFDDRNALDFEFNALYNPSVGYLNYILAVILIFVLHQTILISCGILCGTQTQQFTQGKSGYYSSANTSLLITARLIAFIFIYFPIFLFYFGFIYDFYNITTFASVLYLVVFGIAFILCATSFAIFLGVSFKRREYVPQITLVMSMPLLFALGIIFPNENIPFIIKFFMDFIPITPSVNGFIKINQLGADFGLITKDFYHLLALIILYTLSSSLILKKRYKNSIKCY
ncbi:MAG: ABC transporter permease [Helicobacteraceae bacterium]|nr:ABC transporter permease [Helicobacteraceae bacterium]